MTKVLTHMRFVGKIVKVRRGVKKGGKRGRRGLQGILVVRFGRGCSRGEEGGVL